MPQGDPELRHFLVTFKDELANVPIAILPATKATAMTAKITALLAKMQTANDALIAYRAAIEEKNDTKTTTIAALRAVAAEIKNDTDYTEALGRKLGIIGENHVVDFTTLKPIAKIKKTLRGIEIKYSKKQTNGVIIYAKCGSETEFTRLEKIILSTYLDERPNLDNAVAVQREYYLVYFKADEVAGQASDIVVIKS